MKEKPNLIYIDEIAGNNLEFKEKLITIIKTEFPQEKKHFSVLFQAKNLLETADIVHKLKHKINIFGFKQGYITASSFENELRKGKINHHSEFISILESIEIYLKNI